MSFSDTSLKTVILLYSIMSWIIRTLSIIFPFKSIYDLDEEAGRLVGE
jgi:hypothetical protein